MITVWRIFYLISQGSVAVVFSGTLRHLRFAFSFMVVEGRSELLSCAAIRLVLRYVVVYLIGRHTTVIVA